MRWLHGVLTVGVNEPDAPHCVRRFADTWGFSEANALAAVRDDGVCAILYVHTNEWERWPDIVLVKSESGWVHRWYGHHFDVLFPKANGDKYDLSSMDDMMRFMRENP